MKPAVKIGPCRYLAAAKPRMGRPPVRFFRCGGCGFVLSGTLPEGASAALHCCGKAMEPLVFAPVSDLEEGSSLSYDIVGGLNENCIRVFWQGRRPDWLYLETFRGSQQILLDDKKRPPAVFALAGEDAYAYCDKDPCVQCSFRCKNGLVLYAWYEGLGGFSMELNQIAATPGSSRSMTKTLPHDQ